MSSQRRRVVVTGMGMMTPCGLSLQESWTSLTKGQSGIGLITQFDTTNFDTKIAGEVKPFDLDLFIAKKEQKKMDRFIHLALAAAKMAMEDSGVKIDEALSLRAGTYIGVGMGGLPLIERQYAQFLEKGPGRITPFFIPAIIANLAPGQISMIYGLRGPNYTVTSACASGAHAIGEAVRAIQADVCDVMVAGGTEAVVSEMAVGGFSAMRALSTRNDDPKAASRPWDEGRDGFVLAEGAGILILEEMDRAIARGAKIYGEICGYGSSSDAYHLSSPSPGGEGASRAMIMALNDAKISSDQVDYINAHGTSTPQGDAIESEGIKRTFGNHAKKLWVSSTKSMTGHALGAAGAIESVITLMSLHTSVVAPTINLEKPSPDCDLDYVPNTAREKKLKYAMNNSFGFGGTNCSLIFGKVE